MFKIDDLVIRGSGNFVKVGKICAIDEVSSIN